MHTSTRHRLVFLMCFFLTFPVSVGAPLGLWPAVIAARQIQQDDQIANIPYFSESADGHSILTVQNNLPNAVAARITVFNSKGRPHTVPPVMLAPMLPARFSLKQLTADAKGDFSFGNIQISFQGPPMGVTCQVSVVSERDRFSFESFAAMGSGSTNLRGIAWIPNSRARAAVALTNISGSGLLVAVAGSTGGHRQTKNITLGSRETEIVDLKDLIGVRPESPEAALFDLEHSGKPGDLISTGFVLDAKTGFSSNLNFVDSQTSYSTKLAGARFRFGVPGSQEGFPDGTTFTALLAVANVANSAIDARIVVDLTRDDETQNLELDQIHLEPGALQQIDLWRELRRLGVVGPVSNAGIEITYDATPGSLIASLVSVDQSGDFSFDTPVKDPALNSVSGTYPFRLDNGHSAVLHLKNTGSHSTYAIMQVRYEGGNYNPERIKLGPHQTVGFDLKEMRDAQKPDIRGGTMPSDVTSGQVIWYAEEVGVLVGRAEVFSVPRGVASSFSCPGSCNSSCPPAFMDHYMVPAGGAMDVGEPPRNVFTPMMRTKDCMDTVYGPFDMTWGAVWASQYTSIATVSSVSPTYGQITPVAVGETGITARFTAYNYGQGCMQIPFQVTAGAGLAVIKVDVTLTSSSVTLLGTNDFAVTVLPASALVSAYKIQIRRSSSGTWFTLATTSSLSSWVARAAGNFMVRGTATISGIEFFSTEKVFEVQFPSYSDIVANSTVQAVTDSAWASTKAAASPSGRREEGFWITLNTATGAYAKTTTVIQTPPVVCGDFASIVLGARPADSATPDPTGSAVYTVASFHTHTPLTYCSPGLSRGVGPSSADHAADSADNVAGIVYDYEAAIVGGHPLHASARRYHSGPIRRSTP